MDSPVISPPADLPAELRLNDDFPAGSMQQWRSMVSATLARGGRGAGADAVGELGTVTEDAIALLPLYVADEAAAQLGPVGRRAPLPRRALPWAALPREAWASSAGDWDVRAIHRDPDPERTNVAVLADLASGATSLWLVVGEHGIAVDDLSRALAGVHLDLAPIVLQAGGQTDAAAVTLLSLADSQGVQRTQLRGSLGADPIAARARWGSPVDPSALTSLIALTRGSQLSAVTVDGTVYNDAGGTDSDELAAVTSAGVAYVRALSDAGVADPFEHLEFRYAVGDDQFNGIAKLRAARRMWARIAQLCGVRAAQRQHAVTSAAMMTRRDPWVNILRTTVGCFAAAAGGAQSITVLPFDAALGLPDDFARRMARNTQAVIADESHLGRVVDPGGGSWYVEALTEQLAGAAWEKFTMLERAGGALAALDSGVLAEMLHASATQREARIDTRTQPITGVTAFPNLGERLPVRTPAPAVAAGGRLPVLRYAESFEALRERAEHASAPIGKRAQVTLMTLGPAGADEGRVGFARELFAVAGIDAIVLEFDGARPLGGLGPVVCLCSSDAGYAQRAAAAVSALRSAGVERVLIAGPVTSTFGADGFVFRGCDARAVLTAAVDALEGGG